jgi:NAD-dependent dihydropyrimidine dehydrogenase PreA subunit
MAYVITEPCIDVKDGDCTAACPVDCIYEGGRMFYIQPDECINCGLCLSICPVDAIVCDAELTDSTRPFAGINRDFFGPSVTNWGAPGGWDVNRKTDLDHPIVAAY